VKGAEEGRGRSFISIWVHKRQGERGRAKEGLGDDREKKQGRRKQGAAGLFRDLFFTLKTKGETRVKCWEAQKTKERGKKATPTAEPAKSRTSTVEEEKLSPFRVGRGGEKTDSTGQCPGRKHVLKTVGVVIAGGGGKEGTHREDETIERKTRNPEQRPAQCS